ncbi:MAG: TetR/AcrR family transcriptional regulator [Chloroflexi bacterium]|nr:TetR/AcrR family transcriptional regulator [Chloroflexota bacterium]
MSQTMVDRRVQKTRKLLQEALIELISAEGYEAVTVQAILDRANVGRSTFYAHFQDKEQLLHSCFDSLNALFEERTQQLRQAKNASEVENMPNLSLSLFQFAAHNHRLFKTLLGQRSSGIMTKTIYDLGFAHARDHFQLLPPAQYGPLHVEIMTHYFISALMGVLAWWVEHDMPCTAEEVDRHFRQLAIQGVGIIWR